jgi:endonuclease/exonuclease/phosphatase family metal-dependent hydrolase
MHLRELTINVQHDEGDPRRTRLLSEELRRLEPDVVAFQEVCYPNRWDQLAELVAGTGLHTTHQADVLGYLPPHADRYGGTAVATRRPHRVVELVGQPQVGDEPGHTWSVDNPAAAVEIDRVDVGAQAPRHPTGSG